MVCLAKNMVHEPARPCSVRADSRPQCGVFVPTQPSPSKGSVPSPCGAMKGTRVPRNDKHLQIVRFFTSRMDVCCKVSS